MLCTQSRPPFYPLTLNPMTCSTSPQQIAANQENAKLGGVKTALGKSVVRFNARKHGILSNLISEYEKGIYDHYLNQLFEELQPATSLEEILVERIALYYLRLFRVGKAEKEYVMTCLDPDEIGIALSSLWQVPLS